MIGIVATDEQQNNALYQNIGIVTFFSAYSKLSIIRSGRSRLLEFEIEIALVF